MSHYLSVPSCRNTTISIHGPQLLEAQIVANLVVQQRMVFRSGHSVDTVLVPRKCVFSSHNTFAREIAETPALISQNRLVVFYSFLKYFLTPERQHPQLGCHLSSIIPPLPAGVLRR